VRSASGDLAHYFAAGRGAKYCDERVYMSVSVSVCPLAHLTNNQHVQISLNVLYLLPWIAPPLTTMQYIMYFRFADDVIFTHNWLYGAQIKGRILTREQNRGRSPNVYEGRVRMLNFNV